jgi:2-C-methyl-D-erythritol 4-phosphate cytidylyltransferase
MIEGKSVGIIIPAAGRGKRMGGGKSKQFLDLNGSPVIIHTLRLFQRLEEVDLIIIAAAREAIPEIVAMQGEHGLTKIAAVVPGGEERQESVWNALERLSGYETAIVGVHDAVRPFATGPLVREVLRAALDHGASISAVRPKETVKLGIEGRHLLTTPPRETLWMAQTPQAFHTALLVEAFKKANTEHFVGTDEASLVERLGCEVRIVQGSYDNIKITTPEDMELAEVISKRLIRAGIDSL